MIYKDILKYQIRDGHLLFIMVFLKKRMPSIERKNKTTFWFVVEFLQNKDITI